MFEVILAPSDGIKKQVVVLAVGHRREVYE
jgi:hypothetical protein